MEIVLGKSWRFKVIKKMRENIFEEILKIRIFEKNVNVIFFYFEIFLGMC